MLKDLTYNVIIIDDEVDLYEDYAEIIEEKLSAEGYILTHERGEELTELENYPLDEVDLFLVDLKFGKEDKGPEFIKKIREHHLTDILFYSSDAEAIQFHRKSGEFQGVFFAIRDENKDEIIDMINHLTDKMIKRSNTPISSRGIVLGSVAEIDNIIKSKVSVLFSKASPEQRSRITQDCCRLFFDSYKGNSNKINQFFGCDFHNGMKQWSDTKSEYKEFDISDLVNYVGITDSNKNFRILLKIYKRLIGEDDTYTNIKSFTNLLGDRNIFAHVQEEKNTDGNYQFKRLNNDEYLVLTDDKCRELRQSIVTYFNAINDLIS